MRDSPTGHDFGVPRTHDGIKSSSQFEAETSVEQKKEPSEHRISLQRYQDGLVLYASLD
ncbi:hypothetical protein M407DRAFT_17514 [Tulasnella calospora MUT 4182]|uniref:Uncharacterized protein n=1 Tax=Tulasnella calospora MUT 4182 TaxID=1051891 RepID=A0A0C3LHV1_9AGAM|nr:hypothetical protein M407DRAFT_17514 [Tulasnella calospora MUT 4182]